MERHDLDLTSLIAGLLFLSLGVVFLMDLSGSIELHVRWVWPALLMGLGIALLAAGPGRRNGHADIRSSASAGERAAGPPAEPARHQDDREDRDDAVDASDASDASPRPTAGT